MNLVEFFDSVWIRFSVSGMLILLYGLVEGYARRLSDPQPEKIKVKGAWWTHAAIFVAMSAYYALIAPFGGPLAGGLWNLVGVGLVGCAMAFRVVTARGSTRLRHPVTAARLLFYTALPLAVGVPFGWLALTLPAFIVLAIRSVQEDRILLEQLGETWSARMASTHRWIPGVW